MADYKITATDEQIAAALQTLNLPVFFGEATDDDDLNGYDFIYYRPLQIEKNSINTFRQTVMVYLVSTLSDLDKEMQIIEIMDSIKMQQGSAAQYNRYQVADTDQWINVVAYPFVRLIKRSC